METRLCHTNGAFLHDKSSSSPTGFFGHACNVIQNSLSSSLKTMSPRLLEKTKVTIIDQINMKQIDLQNRNLDNQQQMVCKIISIDILTKTVMP